ncbi:hypothetical protein KDW46_04245 [Burkholderia vietnamiensis]|nr:hypothetical protein [Burkholderia vietnamiensis]
MGEMRAVFDEPRMHVKANTGASIDDVAAGGAFFRVYADGVPVAWYVLQPLGQAVEIAAAYGRASFDLVCHVLPVIELQCRPFGEVFVTTKRRGLMRKLETAGYRRWNDIERGVILRKEL